MVSETFGSMREKFIYNPRGGFISLSEDIFKPVNKMLLYKLLSKVYIMTTQSNSEKNIVKTCNCGANGCVIYPGLACGKKVCLKSDERECKKPIATKIFFNSESYETETKIYNTNDDQLKKLDPEENLFLSSYQQCNDIKKENIQSYNCDYDTPDISEPLEIDPSLSLEENILKQMQSDVKKEDKMATNSTFKAINFSYLGQDMEKIRKNLEIKDILNFLVSFKNVVEGIKLLNENGIYHCDIKLQNIVLDGDKFKIIDFGLAIFETTDVVLQMHNDYIQKNRDAFTAGFISPEFYYHKIKQPVAYGFNNPEITRVGDEIHFNLNLYGETKLQKMNVAYYEGLDMCPHVTYFKNDIWALGCVLKIILNKINNLMETKKDSTVDLPKIAAGLSAVIAQLLILNVENRPTAEKALVIYTNFLRGISASSGGRGKTRKMKSRNRTKKFNKMNKRKTFKIKHIK